MSEFKCSGCEYKSSQKINVTTHINKINKCGENLTIITVKSDINCEFCKKNFSSKPNLMRHLKTCKVKKENLEEENAKLKEKVKEFEKVKIIERKYNELVIKNEENVQLLQKKLDETIKLASKLIDKKILGNVGVETIRSQARKIYKNKFPDMICIHCKHAGSTQVCHIKPISEFNDFSLISEINDIKNLIGLCPNCHIDLDKHKKFEVTRTATLHSLFSFVKIDKIIK